MQPGFIISRMDFVPVKTTGESIHKLQFYCDLCDIISSFYRRGGLMILDMTQKPKGCAHFPCLLTLDDSTNNCC